MGSCTLVARSNGYGPLHEGRRDRIARSSSTCMQLFNPDDYQAKFRFHI